MGGFELIYPCKDQTLAEVYQSISDKAREVWK